MADNLKTLTILQACGSRSWGGLEMQTLKTALGLKAKGHDIAIACPPGSTLEEEGSAAGLEMYGVLDGYKQVLGSLFKMVQLLRSRPWDIIHTHLSHDLSILTPALGLTRHKARLFLTKRMASGVKKTTLIHKMLYRRLYGLITISNYIRESVLNTCPLPPEDVYVLHNGIELGRYDPNRYDGENLRQKLNISKHDTVIGMVGRISKGKGHGEFIHAAAELKKRVSKAFKFIIVGGSSYGEPHLLGEIRALGSRLLPETDLIFTGQQSNIPEYMSLFDILVFPSHEESFGNVLLEAMAMKVPVIACRSGGVPDIVTPGTGLLIPPKDHVALCDALYQLITDSDMADRFAESGRNRVETQFSFEKYLNRLLAYYTGHDK